MDDLEKQYQPSAWSKRTPPGGVVQEYLETSKQVSLKVQSEIDFESDIPYGCGPSQKLDIFGKHLPLCSKSVVFIHGGYWQMGCKDISRLCVKPMVNAGIRVIIPGYDLAPNVNVSKMIEEMKELVSFIGQLSRERGWGDIWYCGHSAGAHLIASLLNHDSIIDIAGLILISGIYDLRPICNTSVNQLLKMDREEAEKCSPLLNQLNNYCKSLRMLIITAEFDSPSFEKQSNLFFQILKDHGAEVEKVMIEGTDHFDIILNMQYEQFYLNKYILHHIFNHTTIQ